MKSAYIVWAALLAATPALAATDGKICLHADRSYQARYLSGHDVVAKQTIGHDRRELKLSTTCINLSSAFQISLSGEFNCLDKGDTVITSTIDGERQSCRITAVEPYVPVAPAQHS
ncbi:MAG TPA: hypothetical protein VNU97_02740 [Rhizomicrobium sp.]|jgi:hypothetical protein|nr:hypothetical protein [Rhizomicrobium sp.]